MASKLAKKWTLENVFPHFMVFSTKSYLVIHDFAIHGFFFPPNTRELRGPPVYSPLQLELTFWGFPYKMPLGARVENYLKVMLNPPIFPQLLVCTNVGGFSRSFGCKISNGSGVMSCQI